MIKFVAIAVIAFVLVIVGSCQMVKCACGTNKETAYPWHCAMRDDPKIKCPGTHYAKNKKEGAPN
jgi:hypothetical protein